MPKPQRPRRVDEATAAMLILLGIGLAAGALAYLFVQVVT